MKAPLRLVILACALLTSSCVSRNNFKNQSVPETSAVQPDNSPDTSGVTVAWPTQVKRFEVINAATDAAVIAAYVNATHVHPKDQHYPALVLAVWQDGRVIHSVNPITGGPPFLEGLASREAVAIAVQRMTLRAVESNVQPRALHAGPDFPTTTLQFHTSDGHVFEVASWHEIMEEDGEYLYGRGFERVTAKEQIPAIIASRTPEYH